MQSIKRFLGMNSTSTHESNDFDLQESKNILRCYSIGPPIRKQNLIQNIFLLAKQGQFYRIKRNDLLSLVEDVDKDNFSLLDYAIKNNLFSIAEDLIDAGN